MRLCFTLSGTSSTIAVFTNFPSNSKNKVCYFIKKSPIELTVENFKENLIAGDISSRPMHDVSVLLDDIFYPILNNSTNQTEWPGVIKKDIDLHIQDLRNAIAEVSVKIEINEQYQADWKRCWMKFSSFYWEKIQRLNVWNSRHSELNSHDKLQIKGSVVFDSVRSIIFSSTLLSTFNRLNNFKFLQTFN